MVLINRKINGKWSIFHCHAQGTRGTLRNSMLFGLYVFSLNRRYPKEVDKVYVGCVTPCKEDIDAFCAQLIVDGSKARDLGGCCVCG